ncbi:MAG: DUF885 domain-containing protein [Chloroflexi bacterium]|nr:DUF885 domain-containing protein [Chloroflexota bacterium]
MMNPRTTLTRRDFLRLGLVTGGTLILSPFLKACTGLETATPTAVPSSTLIPTEDLLAGLDGLDIDALFEEAYRRWLVRDPENLTTLGLSDFYGVGDANLTDISDAFIRQTQALEAGTLDLLRGYDRAAFSPAQALTADVYDWFLDDAVRGQVFMYDDYPLNPIVTSVHYNLYMLFTAYHPLNNRQDANDYISRLSQVGKKITDLIDGLQRRQERGVVLPAFIIPYVLSDINETAREGATHHPYYTTFDNRLTGVSTEDRAALLTQVEEQVEAVVIPGYQGLAGYLDELQSQASNDIGVWQFSDGAAYYAQSLRRQTTTELTADEIHELGKQHVERIQAEMRILFASLGYPDGESIPDLYTRLTNDSGIYQGQEAVTAYEQAIRDAEELLPKAFDILPRASVQVVGGTDGDYYVPASYDGSRPGLFYARTTGQTPKFGVKTLAYHETIPGHHLQIAIAQEQTGLPALRQGMQFNAYTEGWALYAERLMAELGAYADDPPGDLGRLRLEAYRAARLVVDTGIHAKRWGFDQAVNTLVEATGFPVSYAQGEITRYSVWPGQATSYYIGFLKFLELRQKAMEALGDKFDLKAYHHVVLVNGSVPLSILERLVDNYIESAA